MNVTKEIVSILNGFVETDFFGDFDREIDMDSLLFVKFVIKLEKTFHCEIPPEKLLPAELNTINKISNLIIFLTK